MLNLASTSDVLRVITSAAGQVEVWASWVDFNGTTVTPGRQRTAITSATTTTIVAAPASGAQRNVRGCTIANDHASVTNTVTVEAFDGTAPVVKAKAILLPGEVLALGEDGQWQHLDKNGAPYPAAGKGAYDGRAVAFLKTGTAPDATGYWYGTWKDAGWPGAWAPGTPGVNGRATDGTVSADFGCIPIQNAATGANYLTEVDMASSVNHSHMFFDCLWVNSGLSVTTTTAQAITTPTLPARDVNGSTNGEGCMIGILVTAALGLAAVASNATVTYTNSDGTGSRTATLAALVGSQLPATPVVGTVIWFNLAAGDKGVRSIEAITLGTSWVSGSISLIIARPILFLGTTVANVAAQMRQPDPGIRLYSGTCLLHCILASAATATVFAGSLTVMDK